jgi:FMN phosphatase YigB (HAD superfamily)
MPKAVIIAFDIDNTLMDRDTRAYDATMSGFVSHLCLGMSPDIAPREYEAFRAQGNALAKAGLRNPVDERGNAEALAVFCLTRCEDIALKSELGIEPSEQGTYVALLSEIGDADRRTREGSFESRLEAECRARTFCATDPRVERFRNEAKRIARHARMAEWAESYRSLEVAQPVDNHLPLMESLSSRGTVPVVVSEGRMAIQIDKLDRLGLTDFFKGRILISEEATNVPGAGELNVAISRLIDQRVRSHGMAKDPELSILWHYRCLIDTWAGKTPWFFGRCLHAIRNSPESPEESFDRPMFVSPGRWRDQPLRFVMVGDRYDKDVKPLMDLLGPDAGMNLQLRMGKYENLHPESELPPDRRPDRTFTDWDSLAKFLTDELRFEDVKPITTPPDIVPRNEVRTDYIERGLDSPYEAVRLVATAVAQMMR